MKGGKGSILLYLILIIYPLSVMEFCPLETSLSTSTASGFAASVLTLHARSSAHARGQPRPWWRGQRLTPRQWGQRTDSYCGLRPGPATTPLSSQWAGRRRDVVWSLGWTLLTSPATVSSWLPPLAPWPSYHPPHPSQPGRAPRWRAPHCPAPAAPSLVSQALATAPCPGNTGLPPPRPSSQSALKRARVRSPWASQLSGAETRPKATLGSSSRRCWARARPRMTGSWVRVMRSSPWTGRHWPVSATTRPSPCLRGSGQEGSASRWSGDQWPGSAGPGRWQYHSWSGDQNKHCILL